jgi:hypothetical protein
VDAAAVAGSGLVVVRRDRVVASPRTEAETACRRVRWRAAEETWRRRQRAQRDGRGAAMVVFDSRMKVL